MCAPIIGAAALGGAGYFGSKAIMKAVGKSPDMPNTAPAPSPESNPPPTIVPSEISAQSADESRRKRLQSLRYGLASTIKTSPRGITGSGPELRAATLYGKDKLGQ